MKKLSIMLFTASAVAVAGAAFHVHAEELPEFTPTPIIENIEPDFSFSDVAPTPHQLPEGENPVQDLQSPTPDIASDIASESESIGEFGTDDSSVDDAFQEFIDSVDDSGFDFYTPSPDPELDPELIPDVSPSASPSYYPISEDEGIDLYASYNTYYGSISSTYLEFMRGFLPKLSFKEHYVASRTSQYDYIFAYGEDLSFNGSRFIGSDVTVVTWNTYNNGTYSTGVQSSFSLNPGSYLVYSDLSKVYPSLADTAGFTLRQILILLTMFFLGIIVDHMYQVRKIRRIK